MIFNLDLEKQLIGGLLQYPDKYFEIGQYISPADFYTGGDGKDTLHRSIFQILIACIEESGSADDVVVATRAEQLGVKSKADVKIYDYVSSLALRTVNPNKIEQIARELKKYTIRRDVYLACKETAQEMKDMNPSSTYDEIVKLADETFNRRIAAFEATTNQPENIFDEMEAMIEERGNNPIEIKGFVGPHKLITDIYGSILRPGNIAVIVARSGVGKTNFMLDYCGETSAMNNDAIILHLDNGEMSKEELTMRKCSALSGVPLYLLETGLWRQHGEETVDKVRAVWKKIRDGKTHEIKSKCYYYNVAGMSVDQMTSLVRRFYYNIVGRGNEMILAFDYFKTTGQQQKGVSEWALIGEIVDRFKQLIQKEILFNGEPVIAMMSAVQANRLGITTNKDSANVIDDESIVSLSDRIIHFVSHMAILRNKTPDEIVNDGREFGTHALIFVKYRHLGRDIEGALEPVIINDKPRKNVLFFEVKNFRFTECGDLRSLKRKLDATIQMHEGDYSDDAELPI